MRTTKCRNGGALLIGTTDTKHVNSMNLGNVTLATYKVEKSEPLQPLESTKGIYSSFETIKLADGSDVIDGNPAIKAEGLVVGTEEKGPTPCPT